MTSSPKRLPMIDDAMVRRAIEASPWTVGSRPYCDMRKVLEAALCPPEPEEIPISEGMRAVGAKVYQVSRMAESCATFDWAGRFAADIYRAMERVRREELKAQEVRPEVGHIVGKAVRHHKRASDSNKMYPRCHRREGDRDYNKLEAAPYGAKTTPQWAYDARAEQTTGGAVGAMHRHIRAGERCWARSHRRRDDPA